MENKINVEDIKKYVIESDSMNTFLEKAGYKTFSSYLRKVVIDNNIDISHLKMGYKYLDSISDTDFTEIVNTSRLWKEVFTKCGYVNYKAVKFIKERCKKLNLDISHIIGENWAKEKYSGNPKYTLDEICVENSWYTNGPQLFKRLKRELKWEHKCSGCNGTTHVYKGEIKPIPLQVEHINGNHFDNRIENLTFLCANCHSFTDTYCGRNIKRGKRGEKLIKEKLPKKESNTKKENSEENKKVVKENKKCLDCNIDVRKDSKRCLDCYRKANRKVERPSYEKLIEELKSKNYCQLGSEYGVSDNTIRKWICYYKKIKSLVSL